MTCSVEALVGGAPSPFKGCRFGPLSLQPWVLQLQVSVSTLKYGTKKRGALDPKARVTNIRVTLQTFVRGSLYQAPLYDGPKDPGALLMRNQGFKDTYV